MEPDWTSQSFDVLGALLGVLVLIFAVAWILKRLQYSQSSTRRHLKVISVLPLSNRERVVLLQAGAEQVLMGVSSAGIQHLHTLKEPVGEKAGSAEASPPRFAEQLRNLMTRSST